MCTTNEDHLMYGFWDMECERQNFLSFWTVFCPFTLPSPYGPRKSNFWKNEKNLYHFTNVYHTWKSYDVWFLRYGVRQTEFFVILDDFLPCYPTNNPINLNFVQIKKAPGDLILQMCTINENHMMHAS